MQPGFSGSKAAGKSPICLLLHAMETGDLPDSAKCLKKIFFLLSWCFRVTLFLTVVLLFFCSFILAKQMTV